MTTRALSSLGLFATRRSRLLLALAALPLLGATVVQAATVSWTTTSPTGDSGNWSDTTKWSTSALPTSSDTANFGAYANNRTITLDVDTSVNALTIIPRTSGFAAKSFTLSGANTLTIGAGGVLIGTGGTPSVSINIELGADQTWTTSGDNVSNAATFSGTISGTGKLTRTDQLTSNSNSVYTYSGANTFSGGYVSSATSGSGLVVTQLGSSSANE